MRSTIPCDVAPDFDRGKPRNFNTVGAAFHYALGIRGAGCAGISEARASDAAPNFRVKKARNFKLLPDREVQNAPKSEPRPAIWRESKAGRASRATGSPPPHNLRGVLECARALR